MRRPILLLVGMLLPAGGGGAQPADDVVATDAEGLPVAGPGWQPIRDPADSLDVGGRPVG